MKFLKKNIEKIKSAFDSSSNIRVAIFNMMATIGFCVSMIVFITSMFNDANIVNLISMGVCALLSVSLLIYSRKTGNYRDCCIITIVVLFMILFPVMFFSAGGMHSGMPTFFSFAVVFTIFMVERRLGLLISFVELIEYFICCIVTIKYPQTVIPFKTETAIVSDIISGFLVCSVALGLTVYLQTK